MSDPVQGLREMARVTRTGGAVAACVWDHAGGSGPLSHFWSAVRTLDGKTSEGSNFAGVPPGALRRLFDEAALSNVEETRLDVTVGFSSFEDWWEPYTMGVGPPGDYVASLGPEGVARLSA